MTIIYIWLRAVALCLALFVIFGCGAFLVDCLKWVLALGRSRIVRTDRPQPQMEIEGEGFTAPENIVPFARKRLTSLDDRWRRLELDGLAMSPYDLDGHRKEIR